MKLAVVIGGSSGIGYATAKMLTRNWNVVNLSRNTAPGIKSIKMDVTDLESVKNAFNLTFENYGIPDAMIYCSGFTKPQTVLEITPEVWRKTLDTNLTGALYCTQQYISQFIMNDCKKNGKIIFISSTSGSRSQAGWSAYAASKAALNNFAITMSEELKENGIKVYCVAPGRCATPLRKILEPNEDQSKIMQPNEISKIIYYLVNRDHLLDGQVLYVKRNSTKNEKNNG